MKNVLRSIPAFLVLFAVPQVAFAVATIQQILQVVGTLVNILTPIIVGLALVAFIWGLAMYLFGAGTAGGAASHSMIGMPATGTKRDGRAIMIMGVLSLFVIFSVWGLVNILQNTFLIDRNATVRPPVIQPYQNAQP